MYINHLKKHKILLEDYAYKKDIENRLFLADLTPFEVSVLQELSFMGANFLLEDLAIELDCTEEALMPVLKKCSSIGLTCEKNGAVFVDKELRKYYETALCIFSDCFTYDFDYLQKLLKKVPISVLPTWYSIPRTSDNIFQSIIEKYLHTPKLYEKYLQELVFDEPICRQILDHILAHPDYTLCASEIKKRWSLSKEKYQEIVLLLEFHLVAVETFEKDADGFVSNITLFSEYKEFLKNRESHRLEYVDGSLVTPTTSGNFLFLQEMKKILQDPLAETAFEKNALQEKCHLLGVEDSEDSFFTQPYPDQAFLLYRKTLDALSSRYTSDFGLMEKNVHELERALRELISFKAGYGSGWIDKGAFMKALISPIGTTKPVTLEKVGKKWLYVLPSYSDSEYHFIETILFELFVQMGIIQLGLVNDTQCFAVTDFGKIALGE